MIIYLYDTLSNFPSNTVKDKTFITIHDTHFGTSYQKGYFNPHAKIETVDKVKSYLECNKDKFKDAKWIY